MIGAITAGLYSTGVAAATNSYESISTITVGSGGSASIDFTSIPATYKHLQIRAISRSARAVTLDALNLRMGNGTIDTGSNYAWHFLYGNGASALAAAGASDNAINAFYQTGSSATASIFGGGVIDILDYANTSKYKTMRSLSGADLNGSGNMALFSGLWQSTSAVNCIRLFSGAGSNISQYSSFALYGIKG